MRQDVEFAGAHGTRLRGWLYQPADRHSPNPGVVMTHGFSCTRRMGLQGFAERLSAAGFAVLLYDHRGFGDSEGEPRQRINPFAQARDYQYALDWLAGRPGIDGDRLAVWGSSLSAGVALLVAAVDERVRAVVANVPFAARKDVDYSDETLVTTRFTGMRDSLAPERHGRPEARSPADADGPVAGPAKVVALADGDEPFLPTPEATAWYRAYADRPEIGWLNEYTLCPVGVEPVFDPGVYVEQLGETPLLMVVAGDDRAMATQATLAAYDRVRGPKHLERLPGHHFATYEGGPAFEPAAAVMRDFLTQWL